MPSATEKVLQKITSEIRLLVTRVEEVLSVITAWMWGKTKITVRFTWRIITEFSRQMKYISMLACMLLALVLLGSSFHELTFCRLLICKITGWIGITVMTAILILVIVTMLSAKDSTKDSDRTSSVGRLVGRFILIDMVVVLCIAVGSWLHYDFQSPFLRWTQSSFNLIRSKISWLGVRDREKRNEFYEMTDELMGSSLGSPYGIRWITGMENHGAAFSAATSSHIEYLHNIPQEGTLEFWIKVDSGYRYDNYQFQPNLDSAMIFSTDAMGGDVTWPGTARLVVSRNGDIVFWMAIAKYDRPAAWATTAYETSFRFGEWHAVGVSYGREGQFLMVDGKLVASEILRTQKLGSAGTHESPADLPTIGETVSHFWAFHRYEGGFEGVLAKFRAVSRQQNWYLSKGIKQ